MEWPLGQARQLPGRCFWRPRSGRSCQLDRCAIVLHARSSGVRFEWVGVDGGYGHSFALLQTLEDQGEIFVADIHSDRHIYPDDPALYVPPQKDGPGGKFVNYQSDAHSIEVRKWV